MPSISVLKTPKFRRYFFGQVGSDFGSALATVAFAFAVLDIRGSAADLGWVMAARIIPLLLVTVLGGVWTDRLRREVVLTVTNVVSGCCQALSAVLLLTGHGSLAALMVLSFVLGASTVVSAPAAGAIMPTLVAPQLLNEANALSRLAANTTAIVGTGLGGVLAGLIDPAWALLIDALSFLWAAALFASLPASRAHLTERRQSFLVEVREGWREFTRHAWLWPVVLQFVFINIAWFGAYMLIGPAYARESLGGPAAWGAIVSAQAIGAVVGGLITLKVTFRRPMLVGVLCILPLAAPLFAISVDARVVTIALLAAVAGVSFEIFEVQYAVSLQRHVAPSRMARVSAIDGLASFSAMPLGFALAGPLLVAVGVPATAVGAAAVIVLATAATLLAPGVRGLVDEPQPRTDEDQPSDVVA